MSDSLSRRRNVMLALAGSIALSGLALGMLGLLSLLSPDGTPLAPAAIPVATLPLVIALLLGVAQGLMVLLWSIFLCDIGEHRVLLFAALCVGSAAVLALLMSFLLPAAAIWICLSLAWLSMTCFAFIHLRLAELPKPLLVRAKASDKRFNIHVKSTVSVVCYSVALGFAVCFLASSGSGLFAAATAAVAVIAAAAIVAADSTRFHRITESLLAKLHMPVIIIGVAPMFFANLTAQIIGCALLICFSMIVYIVNLTALAEHVRIDHLNSIRTFGFGRAGNAFGFLLGGLLSYLAFYAPQSSPLGSGNEDTWTRAVLLILLGVFVVGSSFLFEDHYPVSKNSKASKPRTAAKEHQLPGSDLRTLSTYLLEPDDDAQFTGHGIWSRRIKALSVERGLSPKETEVLFLLAKGRNAEYIQNELVVSRHTAKAHIYHIYQKTGVHSRQDLINMLENVEIDYE
jgi:DNA-binding CsgD family transcriptional regulator